MSTPDKPNIMEEAASLLEKFKLMSPSKPAKDTKNVESTDLVVSRKPPTSPVVVNSQRGIALKRATLSKRYDAWEKLKTVQATIEMSICLAKQRLSPKEISSIADHAMLDMELDQESVNGLVNFVSTKFANASTVQKENADALLAELKCRRAYERRGE